MSNIEWTDETWNPISGCTRVSAGCDNCYAAAMTHRLAGMGQKYAGLTVLNKAGDRHFNGKVKCHENDLQIPLRWRKPRRIFVNSMSDLFHRDVPFEFIDRVFAVMALCPQHTFQILTKRPERMAEYLTSRTPKIAGHILPPEWLHWLNDVKDETNRNLTTRYGQRGKYGRGSWPLPNVWLGTSCEDQSAADERIPHLLRCPATVRFLSCEPLLGPIEFSDVSRRSDAVAQLRKRSLNGIDWVIVGGESGPGARPCEIKWLRSVVQQCAASGVPCFVKQLGAWPNEVSGLCSRLKLKSTKGGDPGEWPEDLRVRDLPSAVRA